MTWRGRSHTLGIALTAAGLVAGIGALRHPLWSEAAPAHLSQPSVSRPIVPAPRTAAATPARPPAVHRTISSVSVRRADGSGGVPASRHYPDFARLKAFSGNTNYMSLPGYVRYWVHREEGRWITSAEATTILKASRPVKTVRTLSHPRPTAPGSTRASDGGGA